MTIVLPQLAGESRFWAGGQHFRRLLMVRAIATVLLIALFAISGRAFAAPLPIGPVYDQCRVVSENPEIADREAGLCVSATRGLVAAIADPKDADSDQSLTDLVVQLAELPVTPDQCREFDDEIAAAIRIAATALIDSEQAERFDEVADTLVDECGTGGTAAISPNRLASAN
jgi:hypothetical protein